MAQDSISICPGCDLHLPKTQAAPDVRFNASAECYQLFGELSFYTLSQGYAEFIHQMAIDTYEAQHVGPLTKNITGAFGLIGLYLAIERGYNGRQVQQAHMLLAKKRKDWPRFLLPTHPWPLTVADVIRASEGEARDRQIRAWARSVWEGWSSQRSMIVALVKENLAV